MPLLLKPLTCFLFILVIAPLASAQNHIGVMSSIRYGDLIENRNPGFFDSNMSLGLGIAFKRQYQSDYYLSGELSYQKMGYYLRVDDINNTYSYYWKAKAIHLSTDLGLKVIDTAKVNLGISLGLTLSFAMDQEKDFIHSEESIVTKYFRRDDLLISYNLNTDLIYRPTNRIALNLKPNWQFIFHSGSKRIRERNLGLDLILWYQISKTKVIKEFEEEDRSLL